MNGGKIMRALLIGVAAVSVFTAVAQADTISYSSSIPLATTNWDSSITIPLFDPSLGTLDSIQFSLSGHVEGSAGFENKDAEPATITMDLQAFLKLQRPDNSVLVLTMPVASTSDNASAWDGIDDYAGTSGKTYPNLMADSSDSATSSSAADLALFTGVGNITLPVTAVGASTGSGAGNLLLQFSTFASAGATVTYNYTVPEPASLGLMGLSGVALLFRRRR
jgi:hypothetical protein